jgi:hypothetical protein
MCRPTRHLILAIAGELDMDPAEIAAARARLSPEASFDA